MFKARWYFRCGSWIPNEREWTKAADILIPEEKQRIGKFKYQKDAKSSLSGRLLIRKAARDICNIPHQSQHPKRTDAGKPYLQIGDSNHIRAFNVSHSGDLVVLAGDFSHPDVDIGVDVMRIEWPSRTTVPDYFHTMRRQFTESEWQVIRRPTDEWDKMHVFYRFWCLKESYVKAIGVGLGLDLQRLEFHTKESNRGADVVCTTQLFKDGNLQPDWMFEESYIDDNHCVVVALNQNSVIPRTCVDRFIELTSEDLFRDLPEALNPDVKYWREYAGKEAWPQSKRKPSS